MNLYKKLDEKQWNKLKVYSSFPFELSKETLMQQIVKKEIKGLYQNVSFKSFGIDDEFNLSSIQQKIRCFFTPELQDAIGWYQYNNRTVFLSENKVNTRDKDTNNCTISGQDMYYILVHEMRHALQKDIISNRDFVESKIPNISKWIDYMQIYMNGIAPIDCLGLIGNGNLHINPYYKTDIWVDEKINQDMFPDINYLSNMFYYLNASEYDAMMFQYESGDDDIKDSFVEHISIFKSRYLGEHEKIDDILKDINESFYNIYHNISPQTNLQANIMYDLCCLALLQSKSITEQECAELLSLEEKEKRLYQSGYLISGVGTKAGNNIYIEDIKEENFYLYMVDTEKFDNLSEDVLKNNPKLVLYMANFKHEQGKNCDYLAKDLLKEYCINQHNLLCQNHIYMNGGKILFGEDFWDNIVDLKTNVISETDDKEDVELLQEYLEDEQCEWVEEEEVLELEGEEEDYEL